MESLFVAALMIDKIVSPKMKKHASGEASTYSSKEKAP
jgi:hypothetical protein